MLPKFILNTTFLVQCSTYLLELHQHKKPLLVELEPILDSVEILEAFQYWGIIIVDSKIAFRQTLLTLNNYSKLVEF